jgi:competence protein ComEC
MAQDFQDAGVSHILALSGMHLAIVSGILAFLLKRPLGLKPAAVTAACFILLYVYLVGAQPSLVRSALMYIMGTLMILGALPRKPLILLAAAFLVQLVLDPSSGDSASFILSYLALAGILITGEVVQDMSRGRIPLILAQPLAASLGAFIATAAAVNAMFGVLRPVGIPAGLFLVPLSTFFMVAAIVWLGITGIIPVLAEPLGRVLALLYGIQDRLVSLAAHAPGISAGTGWVLVLSLVLGIALFLIRNRDLTARSALVPFD